MWVLVHVARRLGAVGRSRGLAATQGLDRILLRILLRAVLPTLWALPVGVAQAQPQAQKAAAPDYHFRALPAGDLLPVGQQLLTTEEEAFLAALPEVRVALPSPPTRPYEDIAANGEISGIHAEMLTALARTFGLRLKPVVLPDWTRTLQALRERQVDIVLTIGVTAERMDYVAFTLGASPLPGALFARSGAVVDPSRARFALERNFMVNDWVSRRYPAASIVTVETTAEALRAVSEGRADAYLGNLLEVAEVRARNPVPGIEVSRMLSYGTGFYHFGVRKDWSTLAVVLNKGIQSLRTNTTDQLAAALGGVPAAGQWRRPLTLSPAEAELLAARPVWRVGAVKGLKLLNDIDDRGLHSGIASEYTEQLAQSLGVALQVVPFDSVALMLDSLRRRDIDLVPFLTQTPGRKQVFAFSKPYVEMPYTLVARSDAPSYWGLGSLRGKTLALAAQHPLRELLAASYPDIRILDAPTGLGAMDLVAEGRAEAAVEVKLFANLRINGPDGERLRVVAEVAELPAQFHFATHSADLPLLRLVDRALADITPPERQRMLQRWVAVDLSPAFPWRRYAPLIATSLAFLLTVLGGTLWWLRRLKREMAARRRSEELLNDIATTVPGLAFRYVLAPDGSLQHHFFTPGARAFLGRELDSKCTVLDMLAPHMPPEDHQRAQAAQLHSLNTGEPFHYTGRYQSPDGRWRWLRAEAVPTRSSDGLPVWTGYVVDVSAERELQQRLAHEAESRNLLLASASHELRAPTHTLSLALQSLSLQGLDGEQRRAMAVAQDSAHTLAELLNDVLDTARSGQETLQLRPRSFDLHQLLEDLGRAWRAAARSKGLAFEQVIGPDVPRSLQTDPLRLKQVLINLLSNACKYTQQGQVALLARVADDGTLELEVADTGIGIAPADQARLFAPYVTLDHPQANTGQQPSTGLGLASTRRIAALMGGRIELHSTPAVGTRVTLVLPAPKTEAAATQPGGILVCDDDDTSRLLMSVMLRRHGFDTQDTAQAQEALTMWRAGGVAALITDLDMPGMGGLDLARTLRAEEQNPSGRRTVIVICSGSPTPGADDGGSRPLYDAYLVKPVDVATLIHTLARLGVVP